MNRRVLSGFGLAVPSASFFLKVCSPFDVPERWEWAETFSGLVLFYMEEAPAMAFSAIAGLLSFVPAAKMLSRMATKEPPRKRRVASLTDS